MDPYEAAAEQLFLFGIPKERRADAERFWASLPDGHVTKERHMEAALLAVGAFQKAGRELEK